MKYITLIIGLLVMGCATIPVKELTAEEKKVVGEYEEEYDLGDGLQRFKYVFLGNGTAEWFLDGKKEQEYKWAIVNGEIHVTYNKEAVTVVHRINTDISITWIARIWDGKRKALPKEDQFTYKRIK